MDRLRYALNDNDDLVRVGYAAIVGVIAGALGPWFSGPGPGNEILGTDGGGPGLLVLVLSAMAAAALRGWNELPNRDKLIGVAICGGGALVLMGYYASFAASGSVGWGLVLGIASSILLLAVAARLAAINAT